MSARIPALFRGLSNRITRLDVLAIGVILGLGLVVLQWFAGPNFLFFWDGFAPFNPSVSLQNALGGSWLTWLGTGAYSPAYSQSVQTILPYYALSVELGPQLSQVFVFYLSFTVAGLSMYFLLRDWIPRSTGVIPSLAGAVVFMFNWYWIDGVVQDLFVPTVLTTLPLLFLFYRRYLRSVETPRKILSKKLLPCLLVIFIVPDFFSDAFLAIGALLIVYSCLYWLLAGRSLVQRVLCGPSVAATFLAFGLIGGAFLSSGLFVQGSAFANVSSPADTLGYLHALTQQASFYGLLRNIQPTDLFIAPNTSTQLAAFVAASPTWFTATTVVIPLVAFSGLLVQRDKSTAREMAILALLLLIVLYLEMGGNAPIFTIYSFLLLKVPFGQILSDPLITVGFLSPFLTAVMVSLSISGLVDLVVNSKLRIPRVARWLPAASLPGTLRPSRVRAVYDRRRAWIPITVSMIVILSAISSSFPLVDGATVPVYNSGGVGANGPSLSARTELPSNYTEFIRTVSPLIEGQRTLVLPLQSGVSAQVFPSGYVTTYSLLQLETGADVVQDISYGLGSQSATLFSEINALIYDTYFAEQPDGWLYSQLYDQTQNLSLLLGVLSVAYVVVLPDVPALPYNALQPAVNYSMITRVLSLQVGLPEVDAVGGYELYRNLVASSPITLGLPVDSSTNRQKAFVSDSYSSVPWWTSSNESYPEPVEFEGGVLIRPSGSPMPTFVGPAVSLNVSTSLYGYMTMNLEAVNSTLSFYYEYQTGSSYNSAQTAGSAWVPLPGTNVATVGSSTNLTFSTAIRYLPGGGVGSVMSVDWIWIYLVPTPGLPNGSAFGFRLSDFSFTEFSPTIYGIFSSLTRDSALALPDAVDTSMYNVNDPSNESLRVQGFSSTDYSVSVAGDSGLVLLRFSSTFATGWNLEPSDQGQAGSVLVHFECNGFENCWLIDSNATYALSFSLQSLSGLLGVISIVAIALELVLLFLVPSSNLESVIKRLFRRTGR